MTFGAPQFLLLLPLLAILTWLVRPLALWRPLRATLLILVVLAMSDPRLPRVGGGMDLWMLIDRSLSAENLVGPRAEEWIDLLEDAKPNPDDRLLRFHYAADVLPADTADGSGFPGDRDATRTDLAIRTLLSRMDPDRHHRLLLFTDGYSTESLDGLSSRLAASAIPLDYRLVRSEDTIDFQIESLTMPARAQPGEPFLVEIRVTGNADGQFPLTVSSGERTVVASAVRIVDGKGQFRFSDRVTGGGSHRYLAEIEPEVDAYPGNNEHEAWIEIAGGPRVLLVTNYESDPVASVLRAQGFTVDTVEPDPDLAGGLLTGARAVILNNVPAVSLQGEFLDSIDFFVREQGGGLVMAGGRNSFGSGGYHLSAIDDLLPVTMELKSEHRRLAVAMAIVMDRSGSMAAITSSGHTKMALANEGAASAIELLGAQDAVTVFAVDSQAHAVSPLLNVGANRKEILDRVRRVQSAGGGIFVHTGMAAAWEELRKAQAGQKHMILFSDAADSEEPGDYQNLIREMSAAGATVSAIGLGSRGDADAALLESIATLGSGRAFFTDRAGDLPNLFAQETVTVARSTFVEELTPTRSTGRWYEIAAREIDWVSEVDGYNLSYLREGDEMVLVSEDSYEAPLVALGRRGIGRTAAISFPMAGGDSESVRSWEEYGDFAQTLVRWAMGDGAPSGIALRREISGSELRLDLHFDPDPWSERFASDPPEILLAPENSGAEPTQLIWERISPRRYQARTDLRPSDPLRGAVRVGDRAIPFGPITAGYSPEWKFDSERVDELRETAIDSGGRELLDLSDAWRSPPASDPRPIYPWLLWAAFAVFLVETLVTRTGWRIPVPKFATRPFRRWGAGGRATGSTAATGSVDRPAPATVDAPRAEASGAEASAEDAEPEEGTEGDETARRRSRFDRAKRRH